MARRGKRGAVRFVTGSIPEKVILNGSAELYELGALEGGFWKNKYGGLSEWRHSKVQAAFTKIITVHELVLDGGRGYCASLAALSDHDGLTDQELAVIEEYQTRIAIDRDDYPIYSLADHQLGRLILERLYEKGGDESLVGVARQLGVKLPTELERVADEASARMLETLEELASWPINNQPFHPSRVQAQDLRIVQETLKRLRPTLCHMVGEGPES